MLKDTKFQVAVFGFLAINIWQILIADEIIEAIILYKLFDWSRFPIASFWNTNATHILLILREFFVYSFIADFVLIPQFVQLLSTAAYSVYVYQSQPGV
jgi:hypothetical protein